MVTSAWTQPPADAAGAAGAGPAALGLWLRPGQPHPHVLTGAVVRQAVADDARSTALLPQVLTAAVLDVALDITRDLDDIRALIGALNSDLTERARSEGRVVELMHAHAHSIVLTYAHALHLTRSPAVTVTCAADPELVRALDIAPARALADEIARELSTAIEAARASAAELAAAVDVDLQILSAFEFDLRHAVELSEGHAADFARAYSLARGIPDAPEHDLARVFGLASVPVLDPALPLPGVLGLPLRWVADGPLAATLLQVLAAHQSPPRADGHPAVGSSIAGRPAAGRPGAGSLSGDPHLAFARALASRAGMDEAVPLSAALDRSLTGVLRDLAAPGPARGSGSAGWNQATGLSRLTDASAPLWATHQLPGPAEAAALRVVALALAGGAAAAGAKEDDGDAGAPAVLRTVAATVTLAEQRGKGDFTTGEAIILALP